MSIKFEKINKHESDLKEQSNEINEIKNIREQLSFLQQNYYNVKDIINLNKAENLIILKRIHDNINIITESLSCFDNVVSMPANYGIHWIKIIQAIIASTNAIMERLLDTTLHENKINILNCKE
jgi:hypothetical protein